MYSEEDAFRLEVARRIANAKGGSDIIVVINDGEELGVDSFVSEETNERRLKMLDDARYIIRRDEESATGS